MHSASTARSSCRTCGECCRHAQPAHCTHRTFRSSSTSVTLVMPAMSLSWFLSTCLARRTPTTCWMARGTTHATEPMANAHVKRCAWQHSGLADMAPVERRHHATAGAAHDPARAPPWLTSAGPPRCPRHLAVRQAPGSAARAPRHQSSCKSNPLAAATGSPRPVAWLPRAQQPRLQAPERPLRPQPCPGRAVQRQCCLLSCWAG